jgi:hypothetical protein
MVAIRRFSRPGAEVIRIVDTRQQAGFACVIVSAFRAAGLLSHLGHDDPYYFRIQRREVTRVRRRRSGRQSAPGIVPLGKTPEKV